LFHDRNVTAAALAFEDSFVLRYHPLNSRYRARFHLARGQFSQAIDVLQAGVSADPFSPAMHSLLAWACYLAGDSGEALRHAEEVLRDFPDHPISLVYCAMVHCGLGSQGDKLLDRALELASKLVQSRPYFDPGYATLADVLARQGRSSDARAILERQQWLSRERFVMRSFHAPALVALGDLDGALKELAVSEQQHCPWIFELLHDPRLRALAGRPEFERLRGISKGMDSGSPVA
jgi:tetratricopeptide (TPR) repeat protein